MHSFDSFADSSVSSIIAKVTLNSRPLSEDCDHLGKIQRPDSHRTVLSIFRHSMTQIKECVIRTINELLN